LKLNTYLNLVFDRKRLCYRVCYRSPSFLASEAHFRIPPGLVKPRRCVAPHRVGYARHYSSSTMVAPLPSVLSIC
jgi:hypothetical protein